MTTWNMSTSELFGALGEDSPTTTPNFIIRAKEAWEKYKKYHRCVAELNACSDRSLRDLGIFRDDIQSLAREKIYGS